MRTTSNSMIPALILSSLLLTGCEGDSAASNDSELFGLEGSWEATEFTVASLSDSTHIIDLIGTGGDMRLGLQPNARFNGSVTVPGRHLGMPDISGIVIPLSGFIHMIDDSTVRMEFIPEVPPLFTTRVARFQHVEDHLSMEFEGAPIDFERMGIEEPAYYSLGMRRY